ncbi:NAD(P)-dependent oxidoreductase [Brachybacterium sp. ACRRE]|uniref:NAD(P)-dependent oxidoreductase n=1 Tax=Brachybacterium sp. ACRRE TaxID=2918184 RepID=UPI00351D4780
MDTSGTGPEDGLRAGVIGLGMIGGGVATSLHRSGRTPVVYDVRPEAATRLPGAPMVAASPADLGARADVVLIAVVSAQQAREVITGDSGILTSAHPGMTAVVLSTLELPVIRELAAACAERGVGFLDCGVTPGDKAAQNGLVTMVGGDEATLSRARPVLDDFAREVVHCGPTGAGMATKLARNIITYGSWRAVAEAAALAGAAGVDPRTLTEVIAAADPEGSTLLSLLQMRSFTEDEASAFLSRGSAAGSATPQGAEAIAAVQKMVAGILPLMDKDLAAAEDAASELGLDLPLVAAARSRTEQTLGIHEELEA